MILSDNKIRALVKKILLEQDDIELLSADQAKPSREEIAANISGENGSEINVEKLKSLIPFEISFDDDNIRVGGRDSREKSIRRISEYVTKVARFGDEYVRAEFNFKGYEGQVVVHLKNIIIAFKNDFGQYKFTGGFTGITAYSLMIHVHNILYNFFKWFESWAEEYDKKFKDNVRIQSIITDYGEKYEKKYKTSLADDIDAKHQSMKKDINVFITNNPGTNMGGYYSPSEDDIVIKHHSNGKINKSTAAHEFQHRHDELFDELNHRIGVVSNKKLMKSFKYKLFDKTRKMSKKYEKRQLDIAKSSGDKQTLSDEKIRARTNLMKLPPLDYLTIPEYQEKYNYTEDSYYYDLYNLRKDHIRELVARIAGLSDEKGYDSVDDEFLSDLLDEKIDLSFDTSKIYEDLGKIARVLKNTQRNIDYFKRYANVTVKNIQNTDSKLS